MRVLRVLGVLGVFPDFMCIFKQIFKPSSFSCAFAGLVLPSFAGALDSMSFGGLDLQPLLGEGFRARARSSGELPWTGLPRNSVGVYAEFFRSGFRLPCSHFVLDVLNSLGYPLSQFNPSFIRRVVAFEKLCRLHHLEPESECFFEFFKPSRFRNTYFLHTQCIYPEHKLLVDKASYKPKGKWSDYFFVIEGPKDFFGTPLSGPWKSPPSPGAGTRISAELRSSTFLRLLSIYGERPVEIQKLLRVLPSESEGILCFCFALHICFASLKFIMQLAFMQM